MRQEAANRGRFISLEGGEGTGKSTQRARLAEALRTDGLVVVETREPGGSPGAEEIRPLLVSGEPGRWTAMSEALLMVAARCDHVARTIEPALARGDWVISDRFADSTQVYQGVARNLGADRMSELHRLALDGFMPDLTLILDLDPEIGLERAGRRQSAEAAGDDRFERMGEDFHQTLATAFRDLARDEPQRCELVSAEGTVDQVSGRLIEAVRRRLGRPASIGRP